MYSMYSCLVTLLNLLYFNIQYCTAAMVCSMPISAITAHINELEKCDYFSQYPLR